jgi:predicted  nucleic acid-binding Zn-ribbon protein
VRAKIRPGGLQYSYMSTENTDMSEADRAAAASAIQLPPTREQLQSKMEYLSDQRDRLRVEADELDNEIDELQKQYDSTGQTQEVGPGDVQSVEAVLGQETGAGTDAVR